MCNLCETDATPTNKIRGGEIVPVPDKHWPDPGKLRNGNTDQPGNLLKK
jgi:hypothetical protein